MEVVGVGAGLYELVKVGIQGALLLVWIFLVEVVLLAVLLLVVVQAHRQVLIRQLFRSKHD